VIPVGPETVISLLGAGLLGIGGLLMLLPVGTCSQCSHCRLARLVAERERELQAEQEADHERSLAGPYCPACGRQHRPGDEHGA
jgi:hypothetical protein